MTRTQLRIWPWAPPLAIFGIAMSFWLVQHIERPGTAGLAAINALICAFGLVQSISSGLRPVNLVFFAFTFSWLGVAPVYQIATNTAAWEHHAVVQPSSELTMALWMNIAMSGAFLAGSTWAWRRESVTAPTRETATARTWLVWILVIVVLGLSPFAIRANGGIRTFFTSRSERGDALELAALDTGGVTYALVRILPAALSVVIAHATIVRVRARWKVRGFWGLRGSDLILIVISAGLVTLYCNPLSNSRFISIAAFGSLAIALLRPRSRRVAAFGAALALFGTLLIYPLANFFRGGSFETNLRTGLESFARSDFDGFQQVINSIRYVADVGHSFGNYTLSAVGFFVPRSLWEGKSRPASIDVAEHAGYWFTNLSLPIHAELYIEFGWVGVIIGMFALGLLAGRVDKAWLINPGSKLTIFAPYLAVAMLGIVRGPLGSLTPIYLTTIALIYFVVRRGALDRPQADDLRDRASPQRPLGSRHRQRALGATRPHQRKRL